MNERRIFQVIYIRTSLAWLWEALVHDDFPPDSKLYPACSAGWPMILSSLKTLLETGTALPDFSFEPETAA